MGVSASSSSSEDESRSIVSSAEFPLAWRTLLEAAADSPSMMMGAVLEAGSGCSWEQNSHRRLSAWFLFRQLVQTQRVVHFEAGSGVGGADSEKIALLEDLDCFAFPRGEDEVGLLLEAEVELSLELEGRGEVALEMVTGG